MPQGEGEDRHRGGESRGGEKAAGARPGGRGAQRRGRGHVGQHPQGSGAQIRPPGQSRRPQTEADGVAGHHPRQPHQQHEGKAAALPDPADRLQPGMAAEQPVQGALVPPPQQIGRQRGQHQPGGVQRQRPGEREEQPPGGLQHRQGKEEGQPLEGVERQQKRRRRPGPPGRPAHQALRRGPAGAGQPDRASRRRQHQQDLERSSAMHIAAPFRRYSICRKGTDLAKTARRAGKNLKKEAPGRKARFPPRGC
jgi:hypothetical protein